MVFVPLVAGRWMPATRKDAGDVACHAHGPWRGLPVRGGRGRSAWCRPGAGRRPWDALGQVMPQVPALSDPDRAGGPSSGYSSAEHSPAQRLASPSSPWAASWTVSDC